MEKKYKSLSIFEFQRRFPDDASCLKSLCELKWKKGFRCPRCSHRRYCQAVKPYDRQCTSCHYVESPTANTVFHKVKFPLLKAFWIVFYLSTSKKGMATTELSRKLGLRQKTCWLFKRKIMEAMKSSGNHPLTRAVEIMEIPVGRVKIEGSNIKKKRVVSVAIEHKGKGVPRMYGRVVPKRSAKFIGGFMQDTIDHQASIRTDKWPGYRPLKNRFPGLRQQNPGDKSSHSREIIRVSSGFQNWLTGVHHHVDHLQAYVDEYSFRYNRHSLKTGTFDNLLNRLVDRDPCRYLDLITQTPN